MRTELPRAADYLEALQFPEECFSDPDLAGARPDLTPLGLPRATSGNVAVVFRMTDESGRAWAVRCFVRSFEDLGERYQAVVPRLHAAAGTWAVDVDYRPRGIHIGDEWYPIVKMAWSEAVPLLSWIEAHLWDSAALSYLAVRFAALAEKLRRAGIAHGDLQHGNILVAPGGDLRLVDYDGMWVPELEGLPGNELGHRNYAHPRRTRDDFGPAMDAFPAWVVYASLAALSIDPLLWGRLDGGDECLLFRAADFADPAHSEALACLEAGGEPRLVALAHVLRRQAARPVGEVEPLSPATAPPPGTSGLSTSFEELRERQTLLDVLRSANVDPAPVVPDDLVVGPDPHRRRRSLAAVVRRFREPRPAAETPVEELVRRRAQVDADEQAALEDDRRAEVELRHREQVALRAIDDDLRRTLADFDVQEHELSRAERHERADALRALHAQILDGELARHPLASARGAVTDQLVYALALDDVRTAADIADIRTGEAIVLVRRDGREVRITALGPQQATGLLRWRRSVERQYEHLLPNRLPPEREAAVSEAYTAKRAALEDEVRRARADAARRAEEVRAGAQAERDHRGAALAQRKQEAAAERLRLDRELSRARKEHAEARFRSKAAGRDAGPHVLGSR